MNRVITYLIILIFWCDNLVILKIYIFAISSFLDTKAQRVLVMIYKENQKKT